MIRRGTFRSVQELERAIYQWLANWNNEPKPFIWTATADIILEKVRRCKELAGTAHYYIVQLVPYLIGSLPFQLSPLSAFFASVSSVDGLPDTVS